MSPLEPVDRRPLIEAGQELQHALRQKIVSLPHRLPELLHVAREHDAGKHPHIFKKNRPHVAGVRLDPYLIYIPLVRRLRKHKSQPESVGRPAERSEPVVAESQDAACEELPRVAVLPRTHQRSDRHLARHKYGDFELLGQQTEHDLLTRQEIVQGGVCQLLRDAHPVLQHRHRGIRRTVDVRIRKHRSARHEVEVAIAGAGASEEFVVHLLNPKPVLLHGREVGLGHERDRSRVVEHPGAE